MVPLSMSTEPCSFELGATMSASKRHGNALIDDERASKDARMTENLSFLQRLWRGEPRLPRRRGSPSALPSRAVARTPKSW